MNESHWDLQVLGPTSLMAEVEHIDARRHHIMTRLMAISLTSRLFYATDHASGLCFLIDTDAEVSVIPPTQDECVHQQGNFILQAMNNTDIATCGIRSLTRWTWALNVHTFHWAFVVVTSRSLSLMPTSYGILACWLMSGITSCPTPPHS